MEDKVAEYFQVCIELETERWELAVDRCLLDSACEEILNKECEVDKFETLRTWIKYLNDIADSTSDRVPRMLELKRQWEELREEVSGEV